MSSSMEIKRGEVRVWWKDRWTWDNDDEGTTERPPDLVMPEERARWFVTEFLRGPMGPQGPMGAMGMRGRSFDEPTP